jgi:hypothetical protein
MISELQAQLAQFCVSPVRDQSRPISLGETCIYSLFLAYDVRDSFCLIPLIMFEAMCMAMGWCLGVKAVP